MLNLFRSDHMHVDFTEGGMTPEQIRRRCNDFEDQVWQGLLDGTVRSVMRRIGQPLVSAIYLPLHLND